MERSSSCCIACGLSDRRALVDVTLDDGSIVALCGTHAVMLRRVGGRGVSRDTLAAALRDRRGEGRDRRDPDVDALAMALRIGFSGDRRRGNDRRAG